MFSFVSREEEFNIICEHCKIKRIERHYEKEVLLLVYFKDQALGAISREGDSFNTGVRQNINLTYIKP